MSRERHLTMGLIFYPRGGSAQVARYLSRALEPLGWEVSLACGSLGAEGRTTHAATFFEGLPMKATDYTPAVAAHAAGRDPMAEPIPMHPSFEDVGDVPDRVFAAVSPSLGAHQIAVWERVLANVPAEPEVFHLHHLTPIHAAVQRRWPDRPVLTHLHGTELKMLDRIDRLEKVAAALGTTIAELVDRSHSFAAPMLKRLDPEQRSLLESTDWINWRFGSHWAETFAAAAKRSNRIVAVSNQDRDEALRLLGVGEDRVEVIPNGVDTERFDRRVKSRDEELCHWREWLVTDPRGWDEYGEPGSIRYEEQDLRWFTDAETGEPSIVLMYVGRFLSFKRVPLLVRAYARARSRFTRPAPLVIWGGSPGEWEDEHPHTVARQEGEDGIFFVGWRGHDELPEGHACANVLVAPSTNEPFGLVLLEAMACGLPVITTRSGGPLGFVNVHPECPNGWMVDPDNVDALAAALVEAVNDDEVRQSRGENAYREIRGTYSWPALAERFARAYEGLAR